MRIRVRRSCIPGVLAALAGLIALAAAAPAVAQSAPTLIVNGEQLDDDTVAAIAEAYGGVVPGRYWYDPMTGLYGREGGPTLAQGMPGLNLGGPLRADASGGGTGALTGVFINGREIHPDEYAYLQSVFGTVLPGRFWMNAQGIAGYEGGPPQFNLAAAAQAAGRGGSGGGWTGYHQGSSVRDNMVFGGDGSGCYYASGNDGTSWASPGC